MGIKQKRTFRIKKRIILLVILFSPVILIVVSNFSIEKLAEGKTFSDPSKIKANKVGLVLGTVKTLRNGTVNLYFKYRIEATVELYKSGKVDFVLVSGDNGNKNYDEPTNMHDDLVKRGIPSKYITLDYAGFRTLDSIVRAEVIFDLEDYIIVSQRFHLERAIYIAHAKGQKVIGFVAKDFKNTIWAKRMEHRELLARAKAFLDIHILGREPRFLGKKETVIYKP